MAAADPGDTRRGRSASRRDFGTVRRLPSGRWQVRYLDDAGARVAAPQTFPTRAAASSWLARTQTDRERGVWTPPAAADQTFAAYAQDWLDHRPDLRPRTRELYAGILRRQLLPYLGDRRLKEISPALVRRWRADLLTAAVGASTVAKAYRLLKGILNTAVADEVLLRNPCLLRGAATERTPERTPPTLAEVDAVAAAIAPRWRMLVILAAWSGLRWGELVALKRRRVDLLHGTVTVVEQMIETSGAMTLGPPKSTAGLRTVHLPPHLLPDLEQHLADYVDTDPDAWLFTGPKGAPLARRNFTKHWQAARVEAGVPTLHFHDLRHLAATLAATTGATTRELMRRMGHSSSRAALIYQHAAADRDQAIAAALSELVRPVAPTPLRPAASGSRRRGEIDGQLSW